MAWTQSWTGTQSMNPDATVNKKGDGNELG